MPSISDDRKAALVAEYAPRIIAAAERHRRKQEAERVAAAAVVRLASKTELSIEAQQEHIERKTQELIEKEKATLDRAGHNRAMLAAIRCIGEWHARQKQAHMEAEYWALQRWGGGVHNPMARLQREMGDDIG